MEQWGGTWTDERIYYDAVAYYDAVFADVAAAKHSIDVEVYIFLNDSLGRRAIEALTAAARRGVIVRVLVDGFGSHDDLPTIINELVAAGIDARVFRPMPWLFFKMAPRRTPPLNMLVNLLTAINHRNHRKVWVIDGHVAYTGSINIIARHLEQGRGGEIWRDTALRVEGPQIAHLTWAFDKAWTKSWQFTRQRIHHAATNPPPGPRSPAGLVRLNDRMKARRWLLRDLLDRIDAAQRRVWISTPYFVPSRRLVKALCRAAAAGVDVRVLVPHDPPIHPVRWVAASLYDPLLSSGVKIYEYLPNVLHSKILQIDDWATVGSTNFNHRSIFTDLEVDLVVTHSESRAFLEERFLDDVEHAEVITLSSLRHRPLAGKVLGRILLLFRYWM